MTKKVGRVKKLNKAIARERKAVEAENKDNTKTLIFCKPRSSKLVRQLTEDFKSIMKPHTIKDAACLRSSKLKDFIDYAAKMNVKNIIYFAGGKSINKTCDWNESTKYQPGAIYCHILGVPHGPSLTFKVIDFKLKKDFQTESGFWMNENWSQTPCLFQGAMETKAKHVNLVAETFQQMFPILNPYKAKLENFKRVFLFFQEAKMKFKDVETQEKMGEVFTFNQYFIKLENKEINKSIRKLGVGVTSKNTKIPNLSEFGSIADYVQRDEDDEDDEDNCKTIEIDQSVKDLPGSMGKLTTSLKEVGPMLTMQLMRIEEGMNAGTLMYHRCLERSSEEALEIQARRTEKLKLKEKRREQQQKDVEKKKQKKEDHKKACLKGMENKGYAKPSGENGDDDDRENVEVDETKIDHEDEDGDEEEEVEDIDEKDSDGIEDDGDSDEMEQDDSDDDSNGIEDVNDSLDEDEDNNNGSGNSEMDALEISDDGSAESDSDADDTLVVSQKSLDNRKRVHSQAQKNNKKRKM